MKYLSQSMSRFTKMIIAMPLLAFSGFVLSTPLQPLVDDFKSATRSSLGIERVFLTDQTAGGGTTNDVQVSKGVMQVTGDLLPPRGQPAWSSSVFPLGQQNANQDASLYQGIRLVVRVNKGSLSLSANSTKVTNFDYHTAPVIVPSDGKFHQVDVPFETMKPVWSQQTELDPKTLASLSVVAFSLQPSSYDFELEHVSFY